MDENKTYQEFMDWLAKAPMTFPPSEDTNALIKARYTPEDAELLTNVPFDPRTIGEIAEIKQMAVDMNEFFTRFLTDLSDPLPRRKTDA